MGIRCSREVVGPIRFPNRGHQNFQCPATQKRIKVRKARVGFAFRTVALSESGETQADSKAGNFR